MTVRPLSFTIAGQPDSVKIPPSMQVEEDMKAAAGVLLDILYPQRPIGRLVRRLHAKPALARRAEIAAWIILVGLLAAIYLVLLTR